MSYGQVVDYLHHYRNKSVNGRLEEILRARFGRAGGGHRSPGAGFYNCAAIAKWRVFWRNASWITKPAVSLRDGATCT